MVHCHCLAVNDAAIRRVLDEEPETTIRDAIRRYGAGTDCGGCRPAIRRLLNADCRPRATADPAA
jgi:bacterioferritin-associated ferredoxin